MLAEDTDTGLKADKWASRARQGRAAGVLLVCCWQARCLGRREGRQGTGRRGQNQIRDWNIIVIVADSLGKTRKVSVS